jgi:hypothetical protein
MSSTKYNPEKSVWRGRSYRNGGKNIRRLREDQSRNGVRVVKHTFPDGGATVDADCQCFGHPMRVHSTSNCPYLKGAK